MFKKLNVLIFCFLLILPGMANAREELQKYFSNPKAVGTGTLVFIFWDVYDATLYAPDFYARALNLDLGVMGAILVGIRLFDAFQDPFIGYLCDRRKQNRYLFISYGALLLILGMYLLFHPSLMVPAGVWFGGSMALATLGYSIISINFMMMGGFWHQDPLQKTRISGWRESFTLVGLLFSSALPSFLQRSLDFASALQWLFWIFLGLFIIAAFLFSRLVSKGKLKSISKSSHSEKIKFFNQTIWHEKKFFIVCFLSRFASSIPAVLVFFFIKDYLGLEPYSGLFLFLYFISGAVFMGLWVKSSKQISLYQSWMYSMVLAIATFVWAFFLEHGDLYFYGFICVASGAAFGADLALPPAIIAQRITQKNRENEATQYYGFLAFIPKISLAIASGISFNILDFTGFKAGAENTFFSLKSLLVIYSLVPCLIKGGAAFLLWYWFKSGQETYE